MNCTKCGNTLLTKSKNGLCEECSFRKSKDKEPVKKASSSKSSAKVYGKTERVQLILDHLAQLCDVLNQTLDEDMGFSITLNKLKHCEFVSALKLKEFVRRIGMEWVGDTPYYMNSDIEANQVADSVNKHLYLLLETLPHLRGQVELLYELDTETFNLNRDLDTHYLSLVELIDITLGYVLQITKVDIEK